MGVALSGVVTADTMPPMATRGRRGNRGRRPIKSTTAAASSPAPGGGPRPSDKGTRAIGIKVLEALAILAGVVLWFWPDPPMFLRIGFAVVCVLWILILQVEDGRVRVVLRAGIAASIASMVIFSILQIPTSAERYVDSYFEETRNSNIWSQRPWMYEESRTAMLSEFDEFEPDKWNSIDESLPGASAVSIPDLSLYSVGNNGARVVTVGTAIVQQPFGRLEYVLQIDPVSQDMASELKSTLVSHGLLSETEAESAVGEGVDDPEHFYAQVYCRVTARPFFQANGDTVIIKGIPIAYGRIARRDGRQNDVVYMACSAIEHVTW